MIPGPIIIRSCEHCHGLFGEGTLLSATSMGSHAWTDGAHRSIFGGYRPYGLGVCPHCAAIWKVRSQKYEGKYERWKSHSIGLNLPPPAYLNANETQPFHAFSEDTASKSAPPIPPRLVGIDLTTVPGFKRLGCQDWLRVSEGLLGHSSDDVRTFRILAWQAGNDERRSFGSAATLRKREAKKNTSTPQRDAIETENMLWLIKAMCHTPLDQLIKIELYRELEEFRLAHKNLLFKTTDEFIGMRAYLSGLIDARNSAVHLVPDFLRCPAFHPRVPTGSEDGNLNELDDDDIDC